ncbi:MAG: SIR2 family NAD-dependent protein deacylase [Burkholderiales bacterium]
MSELDPAALAQARALLAGADRNVWFTGAGVSAESGIPTFRDALAGMWARFDPERLATEAGFRADPALVWRWYAERRERVAAAQPNAAHRAIAAAEATGRTITVVTQNVAGLHRRAGSSDVVELHGSIVRAKCLEGCGPAPAGWEHDARLPPPCPRCGVPLRPDVGWFGEMLPPGAFERAERLAAEADAMLVVGTSGLVQPAASLPWAAVRQHRPVIVVDPNPTELDRLATVTVRGSAVRVVPSILPTTRPAPPARGAAAP